MRLRRSRLVLPSAFTAGNLFFGFYAIISAVRGELVRASWLVIAGALLDFIDGKVAKFSKTHSRFGMELDSLADLVTFGVAPALVMFHYVLQGRGEWSWLVAFAFVLAGALRLARYNVENPGPEKTRFTGLPIPVSGAALVSFVPFSQSPFYARYLAWVPYPELVAWGIIVLSILMVSSVPYPALPRMGLRTLRGAISLTLFIVLWVGVLTVPASVVFPVTVAYIIAGLARAVLVSLSERGPLPLPQPRRGRGTLPQEDSTLRRQEESR